MRSGLSRRPRRGSGTGSPEHHDADADAAYGDVDAADSDADDAVDGDTDADRPCLPGLAVREVERADKVVVAPNVFRH